MDRNHQTKAAVSNHVCGTFAAAKKCIVEAGRRFAAAAAAAAAVSNDDAIVLDADHSVFHEAAPDVPNNEWLELDNYVIHKTKRTV